MNQIEDTVRLGRALAKVKAPLFLARHSGAVGEQTITLHTADSRSAKALSRQAAVALKFEGIDTLCTVVVHRPSKLTRFRSLEVLTKRLGNGTIVYDPTHFVSRSEALVALGNDLRKALPNRISSLFFEAQRRTLYVIVNRESYASEAVAQTAERVETLRVVTETFGKWQAEKGSGFELTTRIGFDPPAGGKLISVDSLTVRSTLRGLFARGLNRTAIKVSAASLLGLTAAIPAVAQEPAVSAPNVSAIFAGKLFDQTDFGQPSPWGAVGLKGAVPIASAFGLQGDVAVGSFGYYGLGGHLFWRDPAEGLIGAFASYERNNNSDMTRVGAEGEWYANRTTTFRGTIGEQSGTVPNGLFGKLDVVFYATPNFSLTGGVITDPGATYGHAGFEWQPAMTGLAGMSIFADGQFGQANRAQITAGLTFHFGGASKTLIDRDRRDDPFFSLLNLPLAPLLVGYK